MTRASNTASDRRRLSKARCTALGLLALIGCSLPGLHARQAEENTAVVSGRVTDASTGGPIRSAQVRLQSEDGGTIHGATTDADGQFRFEKVAAGRWSLTASKARFVTGRFGQATGPEALGTFALARAQRVTANIGLVRGSTLSGRLLDHYGDPIVGVSIYAMRVRLVKGLPQATSGDSTDVTDDTGAFRIFGLSPGDYYVAAVFRDLATTVGGLTRPAVAYYPSTTSFRDAQRVRIAASSPEESITLTTPPPAAGGPVTGVVLDSRGNRAAGVLVHLNDSEAPAAAVVRGRVASTDAQGRFRLEGVPPGQYRIDATARTLSPADNERGAAFIDVPAQGLSGVNLSMVRGSTLIVNVAAAPGSRLPDFVRIGISAQEEFERSGTGIQARGRVDAMRLQMPGLFGRVLFDVNEMTSGWAVEALEIDGRNVLEAGADFTGRAATINARLVLTDRLAQVSGVVSTRGDVSGAAVVVFPDSAARWSYPSSHIRIGRPDREGRYAIEGLPPSNGYRAIALTSFEEESLLEPRFLEQLLARSVELRLEKGAKRTLDLTAVAP